MKTSKWLYNLLLISSLLFASNGFAAAQPMAQATASADPVAPMIEVTFNGTEGNFLIFTVKTTTPSRSFLTIRTDNGTDIHREANNEGANLRRFKIEKGELRSVQFILAINRKQYARTFKVNTSYTEQTDVEESTR